MELILNENPFSSGASWAADLDIGTPNKEASIRISTSSGMRRSDRFKTSMSLLDELKVVLTRK